MPMLAKKGIQLPILHSEEVKNFTNPNKKKEVINVNKHEARQKQHI